MAILALLARAIIALRKVARFVFWKGDGTRRRRVVTRRRSRSRYGQVRALMHVFTPAFVVQLPLRSLASLLDTTRMLRFIALPARLARAMMVDALRLLAAPRGAIRVEAMRSLAFTALMQVVVVAFRHLPHLRILASLVEATISLLFLMAIRALIQVFTPAFVVQLPLRSL